MSVESERDRYSPIRFGTLKLIGICAAWGVVIFGIWAVIMLHTMPTTFDYVSLGLLALLFLILWGISCWIQDTFLGRQPYEIFGMVFFDRYVSANLLGSYVVYYSCAEHGCVARVHLLRSSLKKSIENGFNRPPLEWKLHHKVEGKACNCITEKKVSWRNAIVLPIGGKFMTGKGFYQRQAKSGSVYKMSTRLECAITHIDQAESLQIATYFDSHGSMLLSEPADLLAGHCWMHSNIFASYLAARKSAQGWEVLAGELEGEKRTLLTSNRNCLDRLKREERERLAEHEDHVNFALEQLGRLNRVIHQTDRLKKSREGYEVQLEIAESVLSLLRREGKTGAGRYLVAVKTLVNHVLPNLIRLTKGMKTPNLERIMVLEAKLESLELALENLEPSDEADAAVIAQEYN